MTGAKEVKKEGIEMEDIVIGELKGVKKKGGRGSWDEDGLKNLLNDVITQAKQKKMDRAYIRVTRILSYYKGAGDNEKYGAVRARRKVIELLAGKISKENISVVEAKGEKWIQIIIK